MTPVELFMAAGCPGREGIRDLLERPGHSVRSRDLFAQPISWDDLQQLAGIAGGVRHLLSTQAPGYRGLDRASVSELELLNRARPSHARGGGGPPHRPRGPGAPAGPPG